VKAKRAIPKPARREIFVLTPGEKKIIGFVLIALLLGLTTKHYRNMRPARLPKGEQEIRAPRSPSPARVEKHDALRRPNSTIWKDNRGSPIV
jgi:hypothetical protein